MRPVYEIEVLTAGGSPSKYKFGNTSTGISGTVENWKYKEVLTDGVGYFMFTVKTKKGAQEKYQFYDINLHDEVQIKHGISSLPTNANFGGRICDISAPFSVSDGHVRIISGLDYGEVLLRRHKTNKIYSTTHADDIVLDIISDLNPDLLILWSTVDVETTAVPLQIDTMTYYDVLRSVSDFWDSAGTQIKKDFNVNRLKGLKWASRPWRTSGVRTFTIGSKGLTYAVHRKVDPVRNNITVYGEAGQIGDAEGKGKLDRGRKEPSDGDTWTQAITNWVLITGDSLTAPVDTPKVGTAYICCLSTSVGAPYITEFRYPINATIPYGKGEYLTLNFWARCVPATQYVRLWAPDSSNYFQATVASVAWQWNQFRLGQNFEYDAEKNPTGIWTKSGSPNWSNLQQIDFYATYDTASFGYDVDGLYFGHGRWRYTASDLPSAYGQRDVEFVDESLNSDAQCEKRAKTLLYQLKDPPVQIDVTVIPGDNNILVGDRVPMTVPAENISGVNYDIFATEHGFIDNTYYSKATMVNSANIREPIEADYKRSLVNLKVQVRNLARELQRLG